MPIGFDLEQKLLLSHAPYEISEVLERYCLFYWLTYDIVVPPGILSPDISTRLPLPRRHAPTWVPVVLLPGPDHRFSARQTRAFLDSLRIIERPFAFEFISRPSGAHFQLQVPVEHCAFVEQMVRLHFPQCFVAASRVQSERERASGTERDGGEGPLLLADFYPGLAYRFLDVRDDAGPDPYAYFCAAIETRQKDATCGCHVRFAPFPEACVRMVASELESVADQILDFRRFGVRGSGYNPLLEETLPITMANWMRWQPEVRQKLVRLQDLIAKRRADPDWLTWLSEQLLKKLPAWQVSVRISASDAELIERVRTQFLAKYETSEQAFFAEPRQTVSAIESCDEGSWSVLSTSELAGLAHVPSASALPRWVRSGRTRAECPAFMLGDHGTVLGILEEED